MVKKEKSPYEIKMAAERRDKSFRKNVLPIFSREEFNNFHDVNGNNYDSWLRNRKDTPMNRHKFYKKLSIQKRNDLREQAEKDIYPDGIDNYPTRQQEKQIAKEHPITTRKTKEQKIENKKKEEFIHNERVKITNDKKHKKIHVNLIKRIKDNPDLPLNKAILKPTYKGKNWYNEWNKDRITYSTYDLRIKRSYEKYTNKGYKFDSLQDLRKTIKNEGW